MGTKNETIELQEEIKQVIRELGWSQNLLARKIYTEIHDVDNDREIESFQERLKKELQRPTTKPDKLKRYISIIYRHPEAEHLDRTLNKYVPLGHLSEYLSKGMKQISKDAGKAAKK